MYKAQRLEIELASGLDSILESKDRERQAKLTRESKESTTQSKQKDSQQDKGHNTEQQIIDSLLTLTLINGGYKEKYWSFGEENTQANLLHTNTESKDSKETQENKEKQILEIYFSYGDDTTRLQGDSRHTQDVNLHIITQGYSNGEEVEVKLESSLDEVLIVRGIIQDNQAIIMNPFKEQ